MRRIVFSFLLIFVFLFSGCALFRPEKEFDRFFAWDLPATDEGMRLAAECGVTDCTAVNLKQKILARRYGMRSYAVFYPVGKHLQKLTPEGEKRFAELSGCGGLKFPDPSASIEEKRTYLAARSAFLKKQGYHHGGEPVRNGEVLMTRLPCLAHPENLAEAKKCIRELSNLFDVDGIAFDGIGYTDFRGCHCDFCEKEYREYIRKHHLADTPESRDRFFLAVLVNYINTLAEYAKSLRPDFILAAHLYPVFLPAPLYGKHLKLDLCGETAAWYFLWPDEKITSYTEKIVTHPGGMPFVGWYDAEREAYASFDVKDPARLDHELELILASGGHTLMVCSPRGFLERKEYRDVFRKHMRRPRPERKKE